MNKKHLGVTASALLLVFATGSQAQTRARTSAARPTQAASSPSTSLVQGPPIPGLCIISQNAAISSSIVGKAFDARLQQLRAQATAELSAEQTSLQTDIKAFQAKRASLTQDQLAQQAQPLQQRSDALSRKAQQRSGELEYTARHQVSRIAQTLTPIVQAAYQDHHCSILLNADQNVVAGSPQMDITGAVVQQLNARMTTITFDRETPPASAQQ